MNSVGVVVFVRVSCARSIAPLRVRVTGHSALGLDRVRGKHQKATSIDVRQITIATPHTQQDRTSCSSTYITRSAFICRTDINSID